MKPAYLIHDTRDDRREIHQLLTRLAPSARVRFLEWACAHARVQTRKETVTRPTVGLDVYALARLAQRDDSADARLSLTVFYDLWTLAIQYDFDLSAALAELTRRVRQSSSPGGSGPRLFRV